MIYYLLLSLGIITFFLGIIPLIFSYRLKQYVKEALNKSIPEYTPMVSLILPCKGLDPGFEENINALMNQNYPDYEVVFVTATDDDPAYVFLNKLLKKNSYNNISAKLVVAEISPLRGQKINNMLKALQNVRADTQVFAFVDSDIRPNNNFLRNLVKPLQNDNVGVTTGNIWYLPKHANLGSMLRSLWAAGAYPLLIDQRHNFAWGGANAIKRTTFEKAKIEKLLDRSISDSFAITNGIKGIGLQVHFVPQCVVVSHEDSTLSDTLEWTNRQTIISRVYSPTFWRTVFLVYSFSNIMLLSGVTILILSIMSSNTTFILPELLMLSIIPLEMINAAILLPVVQQMIPEHSKRIEKLKWSYLCTTALASILMMTNSIVSLTTNEIIWRGVKYKLISPTETKII